MMAQQMSKHKYEYDKNKEIMRLNANPDDIDSQRKIQEMINQEEIQRNMEQAMEENPESFGRVIMLYIDCKVCAVR